jgi:phosphate-selective porin OprO/OprP
MDNRVFNSKTLFLTFFCCIVTFIPAHAKDLDNSTYLDLIATLLENKIITVEQHKKLKTQAHIAESESDDENELSIKTHGGLEVASYNGKHSFEISGRLMFDYASFEEDKNKLGNGTQLRRAYIGLEGDLDYDWGYDLTVDFADGEADIKNAYLSYSGQQAWLWKFGNFKQAFSLSEMTSSKYSTFLERPLVTELALGRYMGIGAHHYGENTSISFSLFGDKWDDDPEDEGDEGWGMSIRTSYSPWHTDSAALHLALAASHQIPDSEHQVKFKTEAESKTSSIDYLNTGKITAVDEINRYGFESAWVKGPFSIQAEYIRTDLDRDNTSSVSFDGWYAMSSWILTGESRNYKFKKGSFGRIKPRGESGAWELAIRYSQLQLNDKDINGGEESITTLGLNWYIDNRVRALLNYALVTNDKDADDDGDTTAKDSPRYAQFRLQMDF